MYALLEIVTYCLGRNILVSSALLWILCESRHLLGIGTRLAASSSGEFVHSYSTWTKGEDMRGHSAFHDDDFRPPHTPTFFPIFFFVFGIAILLSCICFCIRCQRRQRRLWANINANPSRPAFEIYPPVIQEEFRPTIGNNDVPPNYRTVVQSNTMADNHNDSLNHYPTVTEHRPLPLLIAVNPTAPEIPPMPSGLVLEGAPGYEPGTSRYPTVTGGKSVETPPPAYTEVAPKW